MNQPRIFIIDALDECSGVSGGQDIATTLVSISRIAPWCKLFVTSRKEEAIESVFLDAGCNIENLSESEAARVNDGDIRTYAQTTMKSFKIPSETIEELASRMVSRAEGLFIWCSTIFRAMANHVDIAGDLESFLSSESPVDGDNSMAHLYELYDQVLWTAVPAGRDRPRLYLILGIILAAARPLSVSSIARFLVGCLDFGETEQRALKVVRGIVRRLYAVIHEEQSGTGKHKALRVYHPSFFDYLQLRSEKSEDWTRPEKLHLIMAERCLWIMHKELKFNVFELDATPVLNENLPNRVETIAAHASEALQYGCEFWMSHASGCSGPSASLVQSVHELLSKPIILFWLEVMSMLGLLSRSELILDECARIFRDISSNIVTSSTDLRRFVASFSEAMASIPHIYLSALTWLPSASLTYQCLASQFKHHSLITTHGETRWDALVWSKQTGGKVWCLACSPDGHHIVCGSGEVLQIRDVQTGDLIGSPLKGHSNDIRGVAYSPNGQQIVSGSDDCTLQRWDAKTGKALGGPLEGHTDLVRAVAYSPDGQRIVSGSSDKTLRLWDARTGAAVREPLEGHKDWVRAVTYSPSGKYILSASDDKTVRFWDATTGAAVGAPLQGHTDYVLAVAVSSDSKFIISGSGDSTLRRWHAETGQPLGEPLCGHTDPVATVAYSSNRQYVVSGSDDKTIRQWDALTGEVVGVALKGHTGSVTTVSYTADRQHIISGSWDGTLCRWDAQSGGIEGSKPVLVEGHTSTMVRAIDYSPDGKHIVSGSQDGTLQICDAKTGTAVCKPLRGHKGEVNVVAYSPDGRRIVSGADDGTVRQWDTKTGAAVGAPLRGHDSILSVTYSPDNQTIVSGSSDNALQRWSARTGKAIGKPLRGHTDGVWAVVFSPDGGTIVTGSDDSTLRRWRVRDCKAIGEPLRGHNRGITAVAYSPDGQCLVSGSLDRTLRQWDASTGQPVGEPLRGHTWAIWSVAYSPNGSYILSGSEDETVRLWDAKTGNAVGRPLRTNGMVRSVRFSPDRQHIAYIAGAYITIISMNTFSFLTTSNLVDLPLPAFVPIQDRAAVWNICNATSAGHTAASSWVKHGDNLLLWIPPKYRTDLIELSLQALTIGKLEHIISVIDVKKLFDYLHDWRQIYSA